MRKISPPLTVGLAAVVFLTLASVVAVPVSAQDRVPIKGVDPEPVESAPTRERPPVDPAAVPVAEGTKEQVDPASTRRVTAPEPGSVPVVEDGNYPTDPLPVTRTEHLAEDGTPVPIYTNPLVEDQLAPASGASQVLVHDYYAVEKNGVLSVAVEAGLLSNDFDLEGDSITISYIHTVNNGSATVYADGHFNFTPTPGFVGTAGFSYNAHDGTNPSTSTTVTIEVFPDFDRPPVAVGEAYQVERNDVLTVAAPGILANDFDPDGDNPVVSLILDNVDHGSLSVFPGGNFTFTPDNGFAGADSFQYRITANGQTSVATTTITVTQSDRPPVGVDDDYNVVMNEDLIVSAPGILANDYDPDSDAPAVTLILDGVDSGSLSVFGDGRFN